MEGVLGNKKAEMLQVFKGVLVSVCTSLICILIFAILLKFIDVNDTFIKIINQAIKFFSILLGVFFCIRKTKTNGFLKGISIGAIYTILAFAIFSILSGGFSLSWTLLFDMVFGSVIGMTFGIVFVNMNK